MGIDPKAWGQSYWNMLFFSAANATDATRKRVFKSLVLVLSSPGGLPCEECNQEFNTMVRQKGFTVDEHIDNNEYLVFLVWKWKTMVNARLGKPNLPWEEAKNRYMSSETTCDAKCASTR